MRYRPIILMRDVLHAALLLATRSLTGSYSRRRARELRISASRIAVILPTRSWAILAAGLRHHFICYAISRI